MNLTKCTVTSLTAMKTVYAPKSVFTNGRGFNALSFRFSGRNLFFSDGKEQVSEKGSVTFIPAGVSYRQITEIESRQIAVNFSTLENIGSEIIVFKPESTFDAETIFRSLFRLWEISHNEHSLRCMAELYTLLAALDTEYDDAARTQNKLLDKTVEIIHTNYKKSDFNVGGLPALAHVSPAYYRRVFHRIYDCSPVEYLKKLRLDYAKNLLRDGHYTIREVAELSGFSSLEYFCAEFKRATGLTPRGFLK